MKKNFTKLTAALIAGVWTLGLQAQTDVTSQYLTNAGFDDETSFVTGNVRTYVKDVLEGDVAQALPVNGWTLAVENGDARACGAVAFGASYYFGGEGYVAPAEAKEEASAGLLGLVNVWDAVTNYVQEVTLAPGVYELSYLVYNKGANAAGGKDIQANLFGYIAPDGTTNYGSVKTFNLDAWTLDVVKFSVAEEGVGKISVGFDATNVGNASSPHLFVDYVKLTYLGIDKTDLNNAIAEATTLYGDGSGVGAAALKSAIDAAQAVADNVDATMADIETAKADLAEAVKDYNYAPYSPQNPLDMTSWIVNPTMDNKDAWVTINGVQNCALASNKTGDFTGNFYEHWNPSAYTGKFYQTITGLPDGTYEMKAAIFGNAAAAGSGLYLYANDAQTEVTTQEPTYHTVTGIVVNGGTLELGWKQDVATSNWVGSDNYTLTYLGYDVTVAVEALNAQITAAKALGKMDAEVKAALDAAIANAEEAVAVATKSALGKATEKLSAAVTAAEASIADYAKLNTAITDAEALFTAWDEKYGTVESLTCGLSEAIEAAKSTYEAGTAVVADEVAKLAAAKIAFAKTVKPIDGEPLDFTDLYIVNPEANDGVNGWVIEGDKVGTKNGEHYSDKTNPYFDTENWDATSWDVTLTQEITNLPAGDYTVKCVSRASANVPLTLILTSGENTVRSTGTSVGASGGELGTYGWGNQSADITVGEDGILKIAFNTSASVVHEWASFDEFQLIFNKKAMSPELKAAVANLQELYDEINLFLGELDKEDATYGEMYLAWVQEFDSGAAPVIEECLANPTSVDEVGMWIATLKQWYEPKTTTILLIECEELYASYENPSDEAGFANAISEVKNFDDLYGTPEEYAQLIEDLKVAREAFIYENMATETYLFAWGNVTAGSIEGTEVNNRLVGNAGDTAEGLILELTGNTGKAYSAANKINVPLPDGTTGERTTIKLSNGAQNTLYLPKGKIATKITFYSYINHNAEKRASNIGGSNDNTGYGYRASYWKEVAGTNYTAETATLMNIFVDGVRQEDGSVVTEGYEKGSCDAISFPLNGVKDVITFTNTGEQACFIIAVELADDPAIAALKKAIADAEAFVATLNADDENEGAVIEMLNPEIEYSQELLADLSTTTMEDIQNQADYLNAAVAQWKEMMEKQVVANEIQALIPVAMEIYSSIDETVRTDEAGLFNAIQNADMASMNLRWSTLEGLQEAKVALETALEAFKVENKYVDPEMKAALTELEAALVVAKEFAASITNPEASATHYEAYNMAMSMVAAGEAYIADPSTATLADVNGLTTAINEQIPLYKSLLEAADAKLAAIAEAQTAVEAAEATYAKYENPVDNAGLADAITNVKGIIDELANPWGMSTVEDLTAAVTKMKEAEAAFIAENELVGIDNVEAGKEVVAVKYFTLNGVELTEPVEGVIVKKTLYADGTVTTVKMVVKK